MSNCLVSNDLGGLHRVSMTQPGVIVVVVSSRVTRGTWPDDGPATDLRHGANARR
jgi:hypothetical protein